MYISKLVFPAMLVLKGLAQVTQASEDSAIDSQEQTNFFTGIEEAAVSQSDSVAELMAEDADDDHELDARDPAPQGPRRRCRYREYWDYRSRRCRRYRPFPRPQCPPGQRPYCGRDRQNWAPYGT
ncbi:hypothetical protein F4802DRAFT_599457 [Xylaria palmicola]|nr:hypothetical protein F4802DRAFT_599457 [Xylaria palmicola]